MARGGGERARARAGGGAASAAERGRGRKQRLRERSAGIWAPGAVRGRPGMRSMFVSVERK